MPKDVYTDPPKPAKPTPGELGDSAEIAITGYVVNKDYNKKLIGPQGVAVFNEMRLGDATIRAVLAALKLPLLRGNWYFTAASEKKVDQDIKDFVEDQIMECATRTWQEILESILLYLDLGRYPFEIIWKFLPDGKIGFDKLAPRSPETILSWRLPNGERGIVQYTVNGQFEIPIEKMIIFVNQKEGENWEGVSILRPAYKHWYMKDKMYLIEAISAERQGVGIPYVKYPGDATPEEITKAEELAKNMRANQQGFLAFDNTWDVGILNVQGNTTKNLSSSIQHHDRQILKTVLAQFLDLGARNSGGSFALSKDQSDLFILSLESIANYVESIINKYLVQRLVDFNFIVDPEQGYPKLTHDPIGQIDADGLSTSIQRLIQTGVLKPQATDEDFFRSILGMPEKDEYVDPDPSIIDEVLAPAEAAANGQAQAEQPQEDPANPGFDTNGDPMPTDSSGDQAPDPAKADWTDEQWRSYAGENHLDTLIGGVVGVPLSEETKMKISLALSKGKGKGKGGANKVRQQKIQEVQSQLQKMRTDARTQLLEMKAKGQKMNPQDQAKFQLNLLNQTKPLMDKISALHKTASEQDDKAGELLLRAEDAITKLEESLK